MGLGVSDREAWVLSCCRSEPKSVRRTVRLVDCCSTTRLMSAIRLNVTSSNTNTISNIKAFIEAGMSV